VCRGAVTHFFICANGQRAIFDSKTIDSAWKDKKEPKGYEANLKALADQGLDPIRVWAEKCRRKGVVPWVSIRMNDIHCVNEPTNPYLSSFWRNHPELWRGGQKDGQHGLRAFDFSKKEVRTISRFVKEVIDRYECVEGIELDWLRFPDHLPPGRVGKQLFSPIPARRTRVRERLLEKRGCPWCFRARGGVPENASATLGRARVGQEGLGSHRAAQLPLRARFECRSPAGSSSSRRRIRAYGCSRRDASTRSKTSHPTEDELDDYCLGLTESVVRREGIYLFNLFEHRGLRGVERYPRPRAFREVRREHRGDIRFPIATRPRQSFRAQTAGRDRQGFRVTLPWHVPAAGRRRPFGVRRRRAPGNVRASRSTAQGRIRCGRTAARWVNGYK
jgi:hypothetical protein